MKTIGAFFFGVLLLVTLAAAQRGKLAPDAPKFDPKNQETITATVKEVKDFHCPVSGSLGAHLELKSGDTDYEVHLAPAAYLKEFEMYIKAGDTVTVTGTKVMFEGKPAILARVVKVKNDTYLFRDEKGRPLW